MSAPPAPDVGVVTDHQYSQEHSNDSQFHVKAPPTLPDSEPIQTLPEPMPVVEDSWEDINITDDDPPSKSSPKTTAAATSVEAVTSVSDKKRTPEAAKDESKATTSSKSKGVKMDSGKSLSVQIAPKAVDEKENVNIIFIGHVDAGKSTIGGHVM